MRKRNFPLLVVGFMAFCLLCTVCGQAFAQTTVIRPPVTPPKSLKQDLGDKIFNDVNMSVPPTISCASCHDPFVFWADPRGTMTSGGSLGVSGNRNTPQLSYVAFTPYFRVTGGGYIGGLFWDGRAKDLYTQAHGPFQNPIEMNNTPAGVVAAVMASPYAAQFKDVYGPSALRNANATQVRVAFDRVADALDAYMSQAEFNNFNSKFDYVQAGMIAFTASEANGLAVFNGKGKCSTCHPSTPDPNTGRVLFTNYTYANLGIPVNPAAAGAAPDLGLGAVVLRANQNGKFRVPTLRNIEFTFPYGHNGLYPTIVSFLDFLNTRDVQVPASVPEVPANMTKVVGNLALTAAELQDLNAFLLTLTDGFVFVPDNPLFVP